MTKKNRLIGIVRHRSFTKLLDFSGDEIMVLIDLAIKLKAARADGNETKHLKGKQIALIFEKASTRTRCSFEVAAREQGAGVTYLGPDGSQIGYKESIKDTGRVLGRLYDAIEYRGFSQENVETLAKYSGVPVYNGLTDEFHPTQVLADVMTMIELSGKSPEDISFCFIGDCRNNVAHSLMTGGAILGMDVRICGPESLMPDEELTATCRRISEKTGSKLLLTQDKKESVEDVDFIYTDVWVSMGEPWEKWQDRIDLLLPYRADMELLEISGNPEIKFMHCLPSFHNRETELGEKIYEKFGLESLEVTDEVFESRHSVVFDQAENRMHTIKAIMVATLWEE
ncbi:MAG: ornithine carbamoyltransferase [Methanomicrobiaceae archaeon]|nr:ornithine carbamoyltransferase [Methanomicrobiaceae archaeon]